MIKNFKNELTRAVFEGEARKGFPADLLKVTRRKLQYLDAAGALSDLRSPPGNRLELLKATGRVSVRSASTTNFAFCFVWTEEGAKEVEFTDYH